MTTTQLLKRFPQLTRDQLYFWEKKSLIAPTRLARAKTTRREYSPVDITKIQQLLALHASGQPPQRAYQRFLHAELLEDKPNAVLRAMSNALSQGITLGLPDDESRRALQRVVECARALLEAESAAVFLSSEASRQLTLIAEANVDPERMTSGTVSLRVHTDYGGGLTGYLASRGDLANLRHGEIRASPYLARGESRHLGTGECYSLLFQPIRDRKGRVIGAIRSENKLDTDGRPTEHTAFDPLDEIYMTILASNIALHLESRRVLRTLHELLAVMNSTDTLALCLDEILRQSVALVHGDRGDLAWWDDDEGMLKIRAQRGSSRLGLGEEVPARSLMRRAFDNGEVTIVTDVSKDTTYHACVDNIASEIVIPLVVRQRPTGVLNIESSSLRAFDEDDAGLLRCVAHYAAVAAALIEGRETFRRRLDDRSTDLTKDREAVLDQILRIVERELGFDAGIIYTADFAHGRLRCAATLGCEATPVPRGELVYRFSDTSLAAKVFRDQCHYFSKEPRLDANVDADGLQRFDINGPVIGVPLQFAGTVIGVLVVWSRHSTPPVEADHQNLRRFAGLVVTTIAIADSDRRPTETLARMAAVVRSSEKTEKVRLTAILDAALGVGFERARLFELDAETLTFRCLDSKGVEPDGTYTGRAIAAKHSRYAQYTIAQAAHDVTAQIRDPGDSHLFGGDPSAALVGKEADLPWVIAPLVCQRRLYGYIAADNARSKKRIDHGALNAMSVIANLAAQVIAEHRTGRGRDVKDLGARVAQLARKSDATLTDASRLSTLG